MTAPEEADTMPGIQISSYEPPFIAPDGQEYSEPWWQQIETVKRASFVQSGNMVSADPERPSNAFLAAQLNAFVVRGALTGGGAISLQSLPYLNEAETNRRRPQNPWIQEGDEHLKPHPYDVAYQVVLAYRRAPVERPPLAVEVLHGDPEKLVAELERRLPLGYIAVTFSGTDYRTVYQPRELSKFGLYAHDPINQRPRGVMPVTALAELQTESTVVVF